MGSNIVSVGNRAGKPIATFTATGQDTGPLLFNECSRWSKWLFQLVGTGNGYQVTLYGTIDLATAQNISTNPEWFELPSPSVENGFGWANPLQIGVGQRACYVSAPFVAVRAVSSAIPGSNVSGTVALQALVVP